MQKWDGRVVYAGVDTVSLTDSELAQIFFPFAQPSDASDPQCTVDVNQIAVYDSPRGGIGMSIRCNPPEKYGGQDPNRGSCEEIEVCTDSSAFTTSVEETTK